MKITMRKIVAILVVPILITACGHKELTSPCSARDVPKSLGTPILAFAEQNTQRPSPSPFADMRLGDDRCGPLKPINPSGFGDG